MIGIKINTTTDQLNSFSISALLADILGWVILCLGGGQGDTVPCIVYSTAISKPRLSVLGGRDKIAHGWEPVF